MELLDRYLQAVKFWLPKNQKQDIIAELSEDIRSQIDDKEAELGRPLNASEIEDLLKRLGRPVLVANRYLPQQNLIGPALFPIYTFVLKVVIAFYLVPWILVWIGLAVSRAVHSGQSFLTALGSFWTSFWPMAFFMVGSITVVFAILERVQAKSKFLENWDPRKLPPVRDPNRIPISNSLTETVCNLVFGIWLIGGAWYQTTLHFYGVSITLAPVWRYLFWGFLLSAAVNTATSAVNVFRPYWTWSRAGVRLATDCFGGALFCWLTKANIVLAISVANVPAGKTAQFAHAINWWTAKMFPWAVGVTVLIALAGAYRMIRARKSAAPGIVLKAASEVR